VGPHAKAADLVIDYRVPGGKIGPLTQKLYDAIVAIQYGKAPDPDGWTLAI